MDLRGKRIVVVGGAGLIGSHVVDRLTREHIQPAFTALIEWKRTNFSNRRTPGRFG